MSRRELGGKKKKKDMEAWIKQMRQRCFAHKLKERNSPAGGRSLGLRPASWQYSRMDFQLSSGCESMATEISCPEKHSRELSVTRSNQVPGIQRVMFAERRIFKVATRWARWLLPNSSGWWMPDALCWWFWNLNTTQWEKWQQFSPWPNFSQFPVSLLSNPASTWTVKTADAQHKWIHLYTSQIQTQIDTLRNLKKH